MNTKERNRLIGICWKFSKRYTESLLFLHDLLGEWRDDPNIADGVEVCGITQQHLRKAKQIIDGKSPYTARADDAAGQEGEEKIE